MKTAKQENSRSRMQTELGLLFELKMKELKMKEIYLKFCTHSKLYGIKTHVKLLTVTSMKT
jgi:hypothetical protein